MEGQTARFQEGADTKKCDLRVGLDSTATVIVIGTNYRAPLSNQMKTAA